MSRNHNNSYVSGLIGNVKLLTLGNGTELLKFGIANVENKKVGEEWQNITHWVNCTLWKPNKQEISQIIKGAKVFASGPFYSSEHEGKTYWEMTVRVIDYNFKKDFAEPNNEEPPEDEFDKF